MTRKKRWIGVTALLMAFVLVFSATAMADQFDGEAEKVIVGKDGWYFYDSDGSMQDYRGTRLFTSSQLSYIKTGLMNIAARLSAQGIDFVVCLPPNKEHVYSEYMPDEYGPAAPYSREQQLYDYLKGDLKVVCPYDDLMMAKSLWPEYDYYYKTDTHWNELGAYIGAQQILTALGTPLPDFSTLKISSREVPGEYLAYLLGEQDTAGDIEYTVSGYGSNDVVRTYISDDEGYATYYAEGSPQKTMTIIGDSFSTAMAPYLGQFYENVSIRRFEYTPQVLNKALQEEPDVIVFELVERYLDLIESFAGH